MPAKGTTPLSLEERKAIERLIAQGHSVVDIARIIGRHYKNTGLEINKNGGRLSYNAEKAHEGALARAQYRISRLRKKFELAQEQKMKELYEQGFTLEKIARFFNTTESIVSQTSRERGWQIDFSTETSPSVRISSLELQMEIVLEQLRKINDKIN